MNKNYFSIKKKSYEVAFWGHKVCAKLLGVTLCSTESGSGPVCSYHVSLKYYSSQGFIYSFLVGVFPPHVLWQMH